MKSKEVNEFLIKEQIYGYFLNSDEVSERIIKFEKRDSQWHAEIRTTYEQESTITTSLEISNKIPESYLCKIRKIKIPINVNHEIGCDGASTELMIGNFQECLMLRWWNSGPKEWSDISKLTGELIHEILRFEKQKIKDTELC